MKLFYLSHSAFALTTEKTALIFDYPVEYQIEKGFDEGYDIYPDEEDNTPYEEPIYGKHNPSKMTIEDALYKGNVDASEFTQPPSSDVEEITDFNLDISDF